MVAVVVGQAYRGDLTGAQQIAAELTSLLPELRPGTPVVFGDIFGGRFDTAHRIVDATAQDDELVLTFEHGETLQVWRPGGLTVSERELVIKDADRVRWEWGDPHGSAGDRPRLSIEHVRHGAQVEVTQEFLGRYDSRRSQPTRRPAVKIVGF